MKRYIYLFASATLFLSACGNQSPVEATTEKEYVAESELQSVYADPDSYKGKYIKVSGQIFTEPQYDDDLVAYQLFQDVSNSGNLTIAVTNDIECEAKNGDYVFVDGRIDGEFVGENAFGMEVTALSIQDATIEVSDYISVVSPALKTIDCNISQNQHDYTITISKVEFAKEETRLYVKIENNGSATFNFYEFEAVVIQGNTQFEEEANFMADYPELQNNILPGVVTEGIITYPAMDSTQNLSITIEASSDNYDEEFAPYKFEITVE